MRCYLVEGIVIAVLVPSLGLLRANPRPGSPRSDDGDTRRRSHSQGHRFGAVAVWEGQEVERHGIYHIDDG